MQRFTDLLKIGCCCDLEGSFKHLFVVSGSVIILKVTGLVVA